MGVIRETAVWPSPVYLIERTDPVMGGEMGLSNVQAVQLGSRTLYLKELFAMNHEADGTHKLTELDVDANAGIVESKLDIAHATSPMDADIREIRDTLTRTQLLMDGVEGVGGTPLRAIYEALMMSWKYGYPRFAFEMFTPSFTLSGGFGDVGVIETIAGDDSIDADDSGKVVVGQTYLLEDRANGQQQVVTVNKVLTDKRVIMYDDVHLSSNDTAVLTQGSWEIRDGVAVAQAGTMYISGFCDILKDFERGILLISHRDNVRFSVAYRRPNSETPDKWIDTPCISSDYNEKEERWRSRWNVPGGSIIFRVIVYDDTEIDHIVLMTDALGVLPSTVRTPVVIGAGFKVQRFGAIYGAKHTGTEFQFSESSYFTGDDVTTLTLPANDDPEPVWNLRPQVVAKQPFHVGDTVYWRVRYHADDGHASLWSEPSRYTHTENPYEEA